MTLKKKLIRNLELLKQFEFEQKTEEAIDDLKRLKEEKKNYRIFPQKKKMN